ncbi:hypothetical protein [Sphingomonas sp. 3-13AW]|uniref:hypothetical protein n=1 Tax=Sphingomonas sp. 3-13AW TaxID=3050450 RepID=UPI003BB6D76A
MIDRNCDATILSGVADRRLADRVLEYARSTRTRLNIEPADFDLGSMLHHDLPFLAAALGAPMQDVEMHRNPHITRCYTTDRSIAEASRRVMRCTVFAPGMPDNYLLTDPTRGNVAALLVDRAAKCGGVARIDMDGPRDALAGHLAAAGARLGKPVSPEWSAGWPDAQSDRHADIRAYSARAFALDDRQLAAELLDHCRDARARLGIEDGPSSVATTLWQTVPSMTSLFGAKLESGEAVRFSRSVRDMDDQEAFGYASNLVWNALEQSFPNEKAASVGERSLFSSLGTGNTLVLLLDRTAQALDADRGGSDDPVGRAVAKLSETRAQASDLPWQPEARAGRLESVAAMAHISSCRAF